MYAIYLPCKVAGANIYTNVITKRLLYAMDIQHRYRRTIRYLSRVHFNQLTIVSIRNLKKLHFPLKHAIISWTSIVIKPFK